MSWLDLWTANNIFSDTVHEYGMHYATHRTMQGLLLKSFIKDKLSECLDLVTELEMRSSLRCWFVILEVKMWENYILYQVDTDFIGVNRVFVICSATHVCTFHVGNFSVENKPSC